MKKITFSLIIFILLVTTSIVVVSAEGVGPFNPGKGNGF